MKNILEIDIKPIDIAKTIPILDNHNIETERKKFEDDFKKYMINFYIN